MKPMILETVTPELIARFWVKVDKMGPISRERPDLGRCWIWTASIVKCGYGQVALRRSDGTKSVRRAHQVAYRLTYGEVPDGLELDHLCRVRACCNPDHLEPVTSAENSRRGDAGGHNARKTHCPARHPYDETNTYRYKGHRYCRACGRIATLQRYYDRRAAALKADR